MVAISEETQEHMKYLESLVRGVQFFQELDDKVAYLYNLPNVYGFLKEKEFLRAYIDKISPENAFVILSVIAVDEGPTVFREIESDPDQEEKLDSFITRLLEVERFYDTMGGIIGYHLAFLKLLYSVPVKSTEARYLKPPGIDITEETDEVRRVIRWAVEHMGEFAEIYPIGGSGDRLDLRDPETGEPLPTAQLHFCGRSLLEGLIRDLEAREFLHYKLTGRSVVTPIVMMTSHEKHNHEHVIDICERNHWFMRTRQNFRLFIQPLVPMMTEDGHWVMQDKLMLRFKPGGHGVIWKLAQDEGALQWVMDQGRKYTLVRQINNPIAGIDYGLLAFMGTGGLNEKTFGFSSCFRKLGTAEGMNVLVEKESNGQFCYGISNIEYTDFERKGVKDVPAEQGSEYSQFPSNTNILFADITKLQGLIHENPMPGMLINMKNRCTHISATGEKEEVRSGRLESTMQNLADVVLDYQTSRLREDETISLQTYLTFNHRLKTISVTKHSLHADKRIIETPEGAYFDLLKNTHDLLTRYCGMELPLVQSEEGYIQNGPQFHCLYHPALGPLFSIIGQKIRGGKIKPRSELQLEISELELVNLDLEGSLLIEAKSVLGRERVDGSLQHRGKSGKCKLKNVNVHNAGIDWEKGNIFWKNRIHRKESLTIVLHGDAEFEAENVTFSGKRRIEVPAGYRAKAIDVDGEVEVRLEPIVGGKSSWKWNYSFDAEDRIVLSQ